MTQRKDLDAKEKDEEQIAPIPVTKQEAVPLILGVFQPLAAPQAIPVKDLFYSRGKLEKIRNNPVFFSAGSLPDLLNMAQYSAPKYDMRVIRFLLSTDYELVFAGEGYPSGKIPAHFQMADFDLDKAMCFTAGNAYFNEDGELCKINHKSGDFRPSFDSLQFLLPVLVQLGVPLAKEIEIEKLNDRGGYVASVNISSSLMRELYKDSPVIIPKQKTDRRRRKAELEPDNSGEYLGQYIYAMREIMHAYPKKSGKIKGVVAVEVNVILSDPKMSDTERIKKLRAIKLPEKKGLLSKRVSKEEEVLLRAIKAIDLSDVSIQQQKLNLINFRNDFANQLLNVKRPFGKK